MKYKQQCTRSSGNGVLNTLDSAFKYSSNLLSMYSIIGFQLKKEKSYCHNVPDKKSRWQVKFNWRKKYCTHFILFYFYQSVLSTASPNPGVSTIVSLNLTPPSFISIVEGLICIQKQQMICFRNDIKNMTPLFLRFLMLQDCIGNYL